jgi:hypothetical protein
MAFYFLDNPSYELVYLLQSRSPSLRPHYRDFTATMAPSDFLDNLMEFHLSAYIHKFSYYPRPPTVTSLYFLSILSLITPFKFYVDSDSVFRFILGRDEIHYKHHLDTDETMPQWQQVLYDCKVEVTHALSPQAKGKVERPYRWIQDHLVRICARENIATIAKANQVLFREVHEYNYKRIHSTTGEIPYLRYQRAIKEKKNLFRRFMIPPPYQSIKDIFCFRMDRSVDAYRTVSINNLKLKFNNAPLYQKINLRIYPDQKSGLSEIRFWHNNKLLDTQKVKTSLLEPMHF